MRRKQQHPEHEYGHYSRNQIGRRCAFFGNPEHGLTACLLCNQNNLSCIKMHEIRPRKYRVIVNMLVLVFPSLIARWKCHECGKTFTITPDFALPNKRYVKVVVLQGANDYAKNDETSYEKTAEKMSNGYSGINKDGEPDPFAPPPKNPETGNEASLAASSIYRWATYLGEEPDVAQKALRMITQSDPTSTLFRLTFAIPARKYRTQGRKTVLQNCRKLLEINKNFESIFKCSLFPLFATSCRDG